MRGNLFLLFLVCANSLAGTCRPTEFCVWPDNQLPVNFVMDNVNIAGYQAPNNRVPNNTSSRLYLIEQLKQWNGDNLFFQAGSLVGSIAFGNVNPLPEEENGTNEITFSYWDSDLGDKIIGATYTYIHDSATQITPYSFKTRIIREADIYIKPTKGFYIGSTLPSGCNNIGNRQTNIETLLKHEMGHALGHGRHIGGEPRNLMTSFLVPCDSYNVTSRVLHSISVVYPSIMTIDINIQSPTENQVVIINQQNTFSANIASFSKSNLTAKQIKDAEDNMIWTSSVDGDIGIGNNITPILETGGQHDLTVTVGKPGDAVYGESFSSYYVIDTVTVTEIVDVYGRTIAYPFPCVRSVSRSDDACLFTVLDSVDTTPAFLFGCRNRPIGLSSSPSPYSEDLSGNQSAGQGVKFDMHIESFPQCGLLNPGRKYYAYSSWVYDAIAINKVDFHLYSAWRELSQDPSRIWNVWFDDMPLVDPEIYVDTPSSDCSVTNVVEKCGIDITWSDKYFLPNAGIFYKENGSNSWVRLKVIPDKTDGTINTGNKITVNGGQLAIYQFAHDIRTPKDNTVLVRAPNGLLAGPFPVRAISSNTTYPPPELLNVETTCANHYCIKLTGHYFAANSTVDIRLNDTSPLLKHVPASDIYTRTEENGKDVMIFPINEIDLQNNLNSSPLGLCFWVSNPTNWSQPMCVKRTASGSQSSFMGKTVTSYRQNEFDQEYNSYEVKNNGQDLEIWGNSWKKIAYNYNVTQNTVLEFSFKSTRQQAAINAIGFITSANELISANKAWQVYGTDNWGNQSHNNYSESSWKTYRISIGHEFTGNISHLVFIADEDTHVGQEITFRNPKLIEDLAQPQLNIAEPVEKQGHPSYLTSEIQQFRIRATKKEITI